MAETREYANRWTDWKPGERETRTRYETFGYGEEARRMAEHSAWQTRQWQPDHGLPADATVVFRRVGNWKPDDDAARDDTRVPSSICTMHAGAVEWLSRNPLPEGDVGAGHVMDAVNAVPAILAALDAALSEVDQLRARLSEARQSQEVPDAG